MLESVFICIYSEQPPPRCCCRPSGMGGLGGGGAPPCPPSWHGGVGEGLIFKHSFAFQPHGSGAVLFPPLPPPLPPKIPFWGEGTTLAQGLLLGPPIPPGLGRAMLLAQVLRAGGHGGSGAPPLRFASHSVLYVAAFVLYWNKGAARPQPMAQSEGGAGGSGCVGWGAVPGCPQWEGHHLEPAGCGLVLGAGSKWGGELDLGAGG